MMSEKDHELSNNEATPTGDVESREIVIPFDREKEYVLDCWKVKNGSPVRTGETVALARLKGTIGSSTSERASNTPESDASTSGKHKRPTRRKRPTVAFTGSSDTQAPKRTSSDAGHGLKSVKLPPTENSKKPSSLENECKGEVDSMETESRDSSESASKHPQSIPIVARVDGIVRIGRKTDQSEQVIGNIEPCTHPAVVDGLCGVCGVFLPRTSSTEDNSKDMASEGSSYESMSRVTVSGGLTFTVSEQEGKQMAQQNAQRLRKHRKLSLILDLDHTLVHATADVRARQHLDSREDVRSLILPVTEDADPTQHHLWMEHFVKLRPNVREFLQTVLPLFEVGVYTAGTRQYAKQIAIVLCRYVVGAARDQVQLDQLRYQVSQAEADLKRYQSKITAALSQEEPSTEEGELGDVQDKEKRQLPDDSEDGDDNRPPKRRKVAFAMESATALGLPEAQLQESHVLTEGEVEYLKKELAEAEMLEKKALELGQRLFGSRIVSRTDVGDLGRDVKSLKRIFPCGGTMAAVVDDREDVWANASDNNDPSSNGSRQGEPPENLLLVRPYHWLPFVGFADINNASGVDLAVEVDGTNAATHSAVEQDVQLTWTTDILKRLHARYYSEENDVKKKSVPELLADMRQDVLQGDKIVLSGLVPLHRQNQSSDYQGPRPAVVRYAESLGSSILPTVTPAVSFVIATKDGTDKTLQGRRTPGCAVVKLSWLMECFWSMTRRDPMPHLLSVTGRDKSAPESIANANGATHEVADNLMEDRGDDDSEEDDDFALEFEKELL